MNSGLVWLLDVVTAAKEGLVADEGIGADLPPIVACFDKENEPVGQAQIVVASKSREDQLWRLTSVATLMRTGWHAHALAIVLEGYLCLDRSEGSGEPLSVRFAQGDKNVVECISVIHATADGQCTIVSIPYKVGLGRVVEWMHDRQAIYDGREAKSSYSFILSEIFVQADLVNYTTAVPSEVAVMAVASQIADQGFFVICQALAPDYLDWINGSN